MTPISAATVETFLRTDFKKYASHRFRIIASSKDSIDFFVESLDKTKFKSIEDLKATLTETQKFRKKLAKAVYPHNSLTELAYAIAIVDEDFRRLSFPFHYDLFTEKPSGLI